MSLGQHPRRSEWIAGVARSDSKIASKTCCGTNASNGQLCRNPIRPSNITGFCYKHAAQAPIMHDAHYQFSKSKTQGHLDKSTVERKAPPIGERTILQRGGATSTDRSPRIRASKPSTALVTTQRHEAQLSNNMVQKPRQDLVLNSGPQTNKVPSKVLERHGHKQHQKDPFNFQGFLKSLLCLSGSASSPKSRVTTLSGSGTQIPLASCHEPIYAIGTSVEKTDTLPARITGSSNAERMDDLVAKYVSGMDYNHKPEVGRQRLRKAIKESVDSALLSRLTPNPEYIYVFRLDGDYVATPRIPVKIGRSKDVDLRLKQWYLQCRYRIDRLEVFHTDYANLVEKMMHLEFEEDRVLKTCRCGRTHKEWFEIPRDVARGRIRRAFEKWDAFARDVSELLNTRPDVRSRSD